MLLLWPEVANFSKSVYKAPSTKSLRALRTRCWGGWRVKNSGAGPLHPGKSSPPKQSHLGLLERKNPADVQESCSLFQFRVLEKHRHF